MLFRLLTVLAVATAVFAIPPSHDIGDVDAEILIVDDISQLDLPEVDIIPLEVNVDNFGVTRYTLGNRQSGDRIVAAGSDKRQWSTPQDIKLTLTYPNQGTGAIVTYVEILVDQSSNIGRGYVIGGGIGQRRITVAIEAQQTTHFAYQASIFGI